METIYNVDYFENKFQNIPEERWVTGVFNESGRSCANGHCGADNDNYVTPESRALQKVFSVLIITEDGIPVIDGRCQWIPAEYSLKAAYINNGAADQYQQPTPKQRILAALRDIKKLLSPQPEVKERTVYVTVDSEVRKLQEKELIQN